MAPRTRTPAVQALVVGLLALLLASWAAVGPASPPAAALPAVPDPTLVDQAVAGGLGRPTAMAQLPDGRTLVTSQTGEIWLVGGFGPQLVLDLGDRLCTDKERGLLGIAVDPDFGPGQRWVYLYLTEAVHGTCGYNDDATEPVNRVVRVRFGVYGVDPASEQVLLDGIPSPNGNHNGGDLLFGADGMLYVAVGDGGCAWDGSGCGFDNVAAQARNVLSGKVLRITRTGTIPLDNPYRVPGSWRCTGTGSIPAPQVCQEIWASGLRNPFRLVLGPDGTIRIHDVGSIAWEEVNVGAPKANYGWPVREGRCPAGSATGCGAPPPGMTNPIWSYRHTNGCRTITGGAWVPGGSLGPTWDGAYVYGDYICARIIALVPLAGGGQQLRVVASGLGPGGPVDLDVVQRLYDPAPRLYYLTFSGGGQLRRLVPA